MKLGILRAPLLCLCISLGYCQAQAQQLEVFSPTAVDLSRLNAQQAKYEKQYKDLVKKLPDENKKAYEKIYTERWKNIQSKFKEREIYTAPAAQQYLDSILGCIVAGNPQLKDRGVACYFSRSGYPNASYIGQGVILFNMGLFTKLENEGQLAFVLCHELAHYYLEHSEKSIQKHVEDMASSELQNELKAIKKAKYGRGEKLEALHQNVMFDSRRHSRDHESEADSVALEFLRNTAFDVKDALTALAMLDKIDQDSVDIERPIREMFHTKEYPFKDRWMKKDMGMLGGHAALKAANQELVDTLKTHPDCKKRIELLQDAVARYSAAQTVAPSDNGKINRLKKQFDFEIVDYMYTSDNYTLSLYCAIQLLQQYPDDPYLVTQVGKIFNACYYAQRQSKLGKKIKLPSPEYSTGYNLLLQFVQNIYMEEYAQIGFYYLNRFTDKHSKYQPFSTELSKSSSYIKS